MDKISRAKSPDKKLASPDQGLKNYGARQFEYAFVKRPPLSPRGKSASEFVQCVCETSYCVGSISCVGCVAQLRKMLRTAFSTELRTASSSSQLRPPQLRTALSASASSSVASVLRPVACQLRSCASPNSMLSRMFRNSRRAATAMKVQRTAERLAHLVELHKRAVVELSKFSAPRPGPVDQSRQLRPSSSVPRQCELRSALRPGELSEASPSNASSRASSAAYPSNLRPCELRPVASSESSVLRPELVKRAEPLKRESPLRKFALVVSQSASVKSQSIKSALVKSASVNSGSVALLRPPKRSLH
jgi:hypothetical protein